MRTPRTLIWGLSQHLQGNSDFPSNTLHRCSATHRYPGLPLQTRQKPYPKLHTPQHGQLPQSRARLPGPGCGWDPAGNLPLAWVGLGTPREGDAPALLPFATARPWEAAGREGRLTIVFLTVLLHVDLQFPLGGFAV